MERLTLPEPAATLWRRTANALERALQQTERPAERWTIGGGTILAQRWGHRASTDIDLTVAQGTGIEALSQRLGGSLQADMKGLGATKIATGETRHRVEFRDGSIDIAELDPRPAGGSTKATIDGHEVNVKSTTQILRGKLERALRQESPVRDLFDIAVAHHADPEALAEAANMLGPEQVRQVQNHWRLNRHSLEQEAKEKLTEVAEEYRAERRDPVERARERLEDARYLAVRIRTTAEGLTIETRTSGRPPRTIRAGFGKVPETLERTGMREFLKRHVAKGFNTVIEKSSQAQANNVAAGTIVEWEAPPRRRTEPGGNPDVAPPPKRPSQRKPSHGERRRPPLTPE